MAMMVVLAAVLLTYGVSTGIAMEADKSGAVAGARAGGNSELPLDMAEDSLVDSYDGCEQEMKKKVLEYLQNEKNNNRYLTGAWDSSENNISTPQFEPRDLEYNTTVRYHALHFLLTTAIQAQRAKDKKQCLTGYRRVNVCFSQDVENTSIRFGSFTSASQVQYSDKSCFEIVTCMGADISSYSKFENEREVLIPPYEVFKVVGIKKRLKSELPCEVVYKVNSTENYVSKLNCSLFTK